MPDGWLDAGRLALDAGRLALDAGRLVRCRTADFRCRTAGFRYRTAGLDAGRLARSQNPEGPATGHLDPGFLGFPGS